MAIGLLGQVAVPARLAAWVGVELGIAAAIDVFPARISAERRTAAKPWLEAGFLTGKTSSLAV